MIDPCGNPYSGARAFFFNAGTTTPRTVYQDGGLDVGHDHPVVANGSGMFPAIFMGGAPYRIRVEDSGGVILWDDDDIAIPALESGGGGGGGDTPVDLLARTGDLKARYATGAQSGWVRCAGRTIGSGSSGAAERANNDCEALFLHLWTQDPNLTISGGRGANAASDWAANKTIATPDFRGRVIAGMAGMGQSTINRIPSALLDGTNNTLGASGGEGQVALTLGQMPPHFHTGTTNPSGLHTHGMNQGATGSGSSRNATIDSGDTGLTSPVRSWNLITMEGGLHDHPFTTNSTGSGQAHPNLQPTMLATIYIKL